jgi:hypothetical protein
MERTETTQSSDDLQTRIAALESQSAQAWDEMFNALPRDAAQTLCEWLTFRADHSHATGAPAEVIAVHTAMADQAQAAFDRRHARPDDTAAAGLRRDWLTWLDCINDEPKGEREWREEFARAAARRAATPALSAFLEALRGVDPEIADRVNEHVHEALYRGADAVTGLLEVTRTQPACPDSMTDEAIETRFEALTAAIYSLDDVRRADLADPDTAAANLERHFRLNDEIIDQPRLDKAKAEETSFPADAPTLAAQLRARRQLLETDQFAQLAGFMRGLLGRRLGFEPYSIKVVGWLDSDFANAKVMFESTHPGNQGYRSAEMRLGELVRALQWGLKRTPQPPS